VSDPNPKRRLESIFDRLLERLSAAAGLNRVWIFKSESLPFQALVVSQNASIEKERALFVDDKIHAVLLVSGVSLVIEFIVKLQRILESGASATHDSHSDEHFWTKIRLCTSLFQLFGCHVSQSQCHRILTKNMDILIPLGAPTDRFVTTLV
jgi:hypothetical protein